MQMKKEIYVLVGLIAIFSLVPILSVRADAGTLADVTITPSNPNGGTVGNYTAAFEVASTTPETARIKLIFPAGFNIDSAATSTITGFGAGGVMSTSTSVASDTTQVVEVWLTGGTEAVATTEVTLVVTGIVSPLAGGSFTMDVETDYVEGDMIEIGTSAAFSITAARTSRITKKSYNINFSVNPLGAGTIPEGGSYTEGTAIAVNAVPKPGYVFLFWEENGVEISKNSTYSFTVNANRELVARFRAVEVGEAPVEEVPVEKPITEMTAQELKAKIVEVQQKIINLLQQLIQSIQQQIQELLAK